MNVDREPKNSSLTSYGFLFAAVVSNFAFQIWVYVRFGESMVWLHLSNPDSIPNNFRMCIFGSVFFAVLASFAIASITRRIAFSKLGNLVCALALTVIILASSIATGRVYQLWADLSDEDLIALPFYGN
jgi:hypothetical protein